ALSSLDILSAGPLTVGLGLGEARNYEAFGVPSERRVARFTEAVRVMKELWTEDRANLAGEFWRLHDVAMAPKPLQKPHIPLWFGGHAPAALRRAAEYADGWMSAGASSVAEFFEE